MLYARLLLVHGRVTVDRWVISVRNHSTHMCIEGPSTSVQPGHFSVGRHSEYHRKLGCKQVGSQHDTVAGYPWSCSVNWSLAEL